MKKKSFWQGRLVLITGAGGFIGSHLAERLVKMGAEVRSFVHYNALGSWGWLDQSPYAKNMNVVAGDITDRDSVRNAMEGVDTVFHLAALIAIPYSYQAPASYVRTNIEGTLNVLQSARDVNIRRVVHTSTSEVYGTARRVPIDETHPLQGQSPYAASKIGADKQVEAFNCAFDLPAVTVRPFNTYGPRQSARAIIPAIATQLLSGNKVKLGNLTPTRDLNYVDDTVAGFLAAGEADGVIGETVNLGSGREISIGDLAAAIAEIVGVDLTIESDPQRVRPHGSEVERLLADNTKALSVLGWQPEVPLERGLEITVAWLKENSSGQRSGRYVI